MARDITHEYDPDTDTTTRTVRFHRLTPERCPEQARRGTGTGACDRPLNEHGYCDRAAEHIDA